MVLAGDLHLTRGAAGMVESAMAVAELERFATDGQAENLMTETNSEHWQRSMLQKTTGQIDAMGDGRGVTRSVGQEHTIGLMGQNGVEIH